MGKLVADYLNITNNNGVVKDLGGNKLMAEKLLAVAFISGANSYNDQYKNNWTHNHSFVNGDETTDDSEYFEFIKDGDYFTGIKVLKDGIYECFYTQRGNGDDNGQYGCVSLNGDRDALEDKYGDNAGPWIHDHSGGDNNYSKSYYFGKLSAGDIISGGSDLNDDGYMKWGDNAFYGQVSVKLIKEL